MLKLIPNLGNHDKFSKKYQKSFVTKRFDDFSICGQKLANLGGTFKSLCNFVTKNHIIRSDTILTMLRFTFYRKMFYSQEYKISSHGMKVGILSL